MCTDSWLSLAGATHMLEHAPAVTHPHSYFSSLPFVTERRFSFNNSLHAVYKYAKMLSETISMNLYDPNDDMAHFQLFMAYSVI